MLLILISRLLSMKALEYEEAISINEANVLCHKLLGLLEIGLFRLTNMSILVENQLAFPFPEASAFC